MQPLGRVNRRGHGNATIVVVPEAEESGRTNRSGIRRGDNARTSASGADARTTTAIGDQAVENGYFGTRSHACDPITCAAGIASIDIVLEENLCERAAAIETRIKTAMTDMVSRYDFIGDVRGRGVLIGIELIEDRATREPANDMCREAVRQCESKGLLVQARGSHRRTNVIRLVPPMVCTDAEIDKGLGILEGVFATLARYRAASRHLAAE